jgi:hypothetical protein
MMPVCECINLVPVCACTRAATAVGILLLMPVCVRINPVPVCVCTRPASVASVPKLFESLLHALICALLSAAIWRLWRPWELRVFPQSVYRFFCFDSPSASFAKCPLRGSVELGGPLACPYSLGWPPFPCPVDPLLTTRLVLLSSWPFIYLSVT